MLRLSLLFAAALVSQLVVPAAASTMSLTIYSGNECDGESSTVNFEVGACTPFIKYVPLDLTACATQLAARGGSAGGGCTAGMLGSVGLRLDEVDGGKAVELKAWYNSVFGSCPSDLIPTFKCAADRSAGERCDAAAGSPISLGSFPAGTCAQMSDTFKRVTNVGSVKLVVGLSGGAIAGIAVGAIAGVALAVVGGLYYKKAGPFKPKTASPVSSMGHQDKTPSAVVVRTVAAK